MSTRPLWKGKPGEDVCFSQSLDYTPVYSRASLEVVEFTSSPVRYEITYVNAKTGTTRAGTGAELRSYLRHLDKISRDFVQAANKKRRRP